MSFYYIVSKGFLSTVSLLFMFIFSIYIVIMYTNLYKEE